MAPSVLMTLLVRPQTVLRLASVLQKLGGWLDGVGKSRVTWSQ